MHSRYETTLCQEWSHVVKNEKTAKYRQLIVTFQGHQNNAVAMVIADDSFLVILTYVKTHM